MQVLDTILSLGALLCLAAFFAARAKVNASLAPLLAVGVAMLFFSLAGVLYLLRPAGWVFLPGCWGLGIYTLVKTGPANLMKKLAAPGFLLFAGLGLVMLAYFAVRQPVFSAWDEFSFWGTAPKLLTLNDALYSTAKVGWTWTSTERPGLPLLGYFMQFLGAGFAAWKVYLGYGLLTLACVGALLAPFSLRRWRVTVPLAAAGLLLPFFFATGSRVSSLATPYLSSYGDLVAGMLLGGVLVSYYAMRQEGRRRVWPSALLLAAFGLVKANILPIVLVAAFLLAMDNLLFSGPPGQPKALKNTNRARWPWAVGRCLALLAAPLLATLVWSRYASWANAQNPHANGAETGVSQMWAVGQTVGQLTGTGERQPEFWNIFSAFGRALVNRDAEGNRSVFAVSMAGSAVVTVLLILGLFLLGLVLARKGSRGRILLAGIITAGGFVGYLLVLLVSYAYIFKGNEGITDFARYLSSYLPGWAMLALYFVAQGAAEKKKAWEQKPGEAAPRGNFWRPFLSQTALLLVCIGLTAGFATLIGPGYSVLDYPDSTYSPQKKQQAVADAITAHLTEDSRTFFVSQGDNGERWFGYAYYFLPHILDYSGEKREDDTSSTGGGNTFGPPVEDSPEYYAAVTPAEMRAYLEEHGCDTIFIERLDDTFRQTYGELFTEGLTDAPDAPSLYTRQADGRYALTATA